MWALLLVIGAFAAVIAVVLATRERTEPCASLVDARPVALTADRHLFTGLQLRLPAGVFATVTLTAIDPSGRPVEDGGLLTHVQAECVRLTHGNATWQTQLHEGERSHRLIAGAGPGPQWPTDDLIVMTAWVRVDGQLYELRFGEVVIGGAYF